jgi:hypothetical protein
MTDFEALTFGVEQLCDELAAHLSELERIRNDGRYSPEHRVELLQAALKEAYGVVDRRIASERQDVEVTRKQGEQALADARYVDPNLLAARAQILSPILNKAAEDPDALITAYTRRFGNLTDRILLQETAEAMIDAGVSGPGFPEKWQRKTANLQLPGEEAAALAQIEAAEEAAEYLDAVEGVADVRLREAAGQPVGGMERMRASWLTATVHRYENSGTTQITQEVQTIA